jgi:hypothetical protein
MESRYSEKCTLTINDLTKRQEVSNLTVLDVFEAIMEHAKHTQAAGNLRKKGLRFETFYFFSADQRRELNSTLSPINLDWLKEQAMRNGSTDPENRKIQVTCLLKAVYTEYPRDTNRCIRALAEC